MFTLIILPNFKGTAKEWVVAIVICLALDGIVALGVCPI